MPQKVDELFWELGADMGPLTSQLSRAQGKLKSFGALLTSPKGIAAGLGLVGAAAAAVGIKATKMAAELDGALREVQTILPGTVNDMSALREQVISLSERVPEPPAQLTRGLYQVISAGVTDTAAAMQVLETATMAATAGLTDTFTAVDALTTVMNSYSMDVSEASRVSDIMFATVREGKTTFPELAANLGNVASEAAAAGVTFEEVSAALATLTTRGLSTAEATTALANLARELVDPMSQGAQAARAYGVEFGAAELEANGLEGMLAKLSEAANGNVEVLREMIPNVRAYRAAVQLTGSGLDTFSAKLDSVTNSSGVADRAFATMTMTLENQVALLQNKLNASFQRLGAQILPTVVNALDRLNRGLSGANDLADDVARAFTVDTQGFGGSLAVIEQLQNTRDEIRESLLNDASKRAEFIAKLNDLMAQAVTEGDTDEVERLREAMQSLFNLANQSGDFIKDAAINIADVGEESTKATEAVEGLAEAQAALLESAEQGLLDATGTAVDNLRAKYEAFATAVQQAYGEDIPAAIKTYLDIQADTIEAVGTIEGLASALERAEEAQERFNATGRISAAVTVEVREQIRAWLVTAQEQLRTLKSSGAEYKQLEGLIRQAKAALESLGVAQIEQADATDKSTDKVDDATRSVGDMTRSITQGVRAAIDMAQAFGVLDRSAASVLTSLVNVGESIAAIASGNVAGGIAGLLGGVANLGSSLFGESAEERRQRLALAENTASLDRLRSGLTDFSQRLLDDGIAIERNLFNFLDERLSALDLAGGPLDRIQEIAPFLSDLQEFAQGLGLSMDDLRRLAEEYGISLDGGIDSLFDFRDALGIISEDAIPALIASFEFAMRRLNDLAELADRDLSDPRGAAEQLDQLFAQVISRNPMLRQLLMTFGGFTAQEVLTPRPSDFLDPDYFQRLQRAIEVLFSWLNDPATRANLIESTGLSGDQLRGLVLEIDRMLDVIESAANAPPPPPAGDPPEPPGPRPPPTRPEPTPAQQRVEDALRERIGQLQDLWELDNVEDAARRLQDMVDLMNEITGTDLAVDVASGESREQLRAAIRSLIATVYDPALFEQIFGEMGPEVQAGGVRQALLALDRLLDQIERDLGEGGTGSGSDGETRGFQVDRTITEVTGNRLAGLLTTQVYWQEQTKLAIESLVPRFAPLRPPSRREPFFAELASMGESDMVGPISVQIERIDVSIAEASDGQQVSAQMAATLRSEIDRALAQVVSRERRARGLSGNLEA